MKKLIKLSIVVCGLIANFVAYGQTNGFIVSQIFPVPGRIEEAPIYYNVDVMVYVPGGVTFAYPVGLFSAAPCIFVQPSVPGPVPNTAFITIAFNNTVAGVTVMVYKISEVAGVPIAMTEATVLDNVTVYVYAVGF